MRKKGFRFRKAISSSLAALMVLSSAGEMLPAGLGEKLFIEAEAAVSADTIANDSLSVSIGDLGQISVMNIVNNPTNSYGEEINFVLPNTESQQNNTAHQWMGEMIFSYRTSDSEDFSNAGEFTEVDTNRTLAAGGSTTATNIAEDNPYIEKTVNEDSIEILFKGLDADSDVARAMKGFNVKSTFDMATEDGSMLWTIEIENTSEDYIEFGDVGLPMPWNNKYSSIDDTYNNSTTVHTFAGADSGYAYAIRCSGEGNYMMFTPVAESGARIEYIDQWIGSANGGMNGVTGTRNGQEFANWTSDTGGWFPGLQVYYIHSKDIQKTGRGYFTDATSLVLAPGESESYQFKFSAVRAGDNTPGESAEDENNASASVEEREANMRSILYKEGMIDAVAVPSFQTAINMPTELDLHYDSSKITDVQVTVQCVHENDPWDEEHIPEQIEGLVNNDKAIECAGIDADSAQLIETVVVDGEEHHVYELNFCCIGNNSVRVDYKLNGEDKFTQFEFNVLEELDETIEAHSDFMVEYTQDTDPESETYGIYSDWYFASGEDSRQQSHWGDDWSHDNINFIVMKNYLDPDPEEVESIEKYLIDFMWNNYMKYTQDTYTVSNYLSGSGIYSDSSSPYTRTYSEVMEATGFFNMYRLQKAYPDLIEYRQTAEWYLEKAFGIYNNRVSSYPIGFYGEQQIPDMIEALYAEGMTEEGDALKEQFALRKGTNMATADYPYGSEFEYDNTGEEGAYAAAKALIEYYSENGNVDAALENMEKAEWKTRAMRGLQPTWYQYADPVFRGGETWWNFQYTASLAGSIMDDWLRYQDNGWDTDSSAWAERLNYAAKISNFNAINMGQISDDYIGNVSWRYTMAKGGQGAQNVNDGGTRVMNNGWNDFSGESDEGLYGSLLSISSDVTTDPVFGLTGYGCSVSKSGNTYTVAPLDGIEKRINIIDEKVYVESEQDKITEAVIAADGTSFDLAMTCAVTTEHVSKIIISGAGVADGYYSIAVNGEAAGQVYVENNEGTAYAVIPAGETVNVTITKMDGGENAAPVIFRAGAADEEVNALVPFRVETSTYDDGAPEGTLTYAWEVVSAPEGSEVTFDHVDRPYAEVLTDVEGTYTLKLTVSDGTLTTEETFEVVVGPGPEKAAPVIEEAAATQHPSNITVAELEVSATADATYNNELSYEWSIVEQPEGGNAVIANADQAEAVVKVSVPGTYTLRVAVTDPKTTIYDDDMVVTQDVVVEMVGEVDGVERSSIVLTSKGEAPVLPETMDVITPEGTIETGTVVWDSVSEDAYAEAGEFLVYGIIEGTDIQVAAPVMVVSGRSTNLALKAIPTAIIDTPQDLGGVAGLNDGYDPTSSRDKSHGVWHNWLGDNGSDAWVQYTWETPVTIYQSNAYYFTDGNFVPKEVWYEYLDSNGEWRPMTNVEGCGTALNQYNETTFDPVTTTAIRMNMTPKTLGCGVIEWQVFGYADNIIDKTLLNKVIDSAEALDLSMFVLTDEDIAQLQAEIDAAQAVYDNTNATQAEVDAAAARLSRIIATLPTADNNLAYSASASTSFVSSWEKLSAVNDGKVPESSYGPSIARYGTWGNESDSESVTYTWNSEVSLTGTDFYMWYDGTEGDYTSGGILIPKSVIIDYLDENGEWQTITTIAEEELVMDAYNQVTFDEAVATTSIRITMVKQSADYNGVGLMEWKVYGQINPADKTALNEAIAEAEELVAEDYTEETWAVLAAALENAKALAEEEMISEAEAEAAIDALQAAKDALEARPEDRNIAPLATATGICDYVNDLGGLATLNDNIDPASSNDGWSNGTWHNWNHRADADGNIQFGWVQYTWDAPVILESTEVYYFTDNGGIRIPEAATLEYLNADGEWVTVEAEVGVEADKYNVTELGNIKTTALRLTLDPQDLISDPANGVGIIEWKVNGAFAADTSELEEAIAAAEALNSEDYVNNTWATLEAAVEAAKEIVEAGDAAAEEVTDAVNAIESAIAALVGKDETPAGENIAPDATADGICNYDGQNGNISDLGGLPTLNDGFDPEDSYDAWSHGAWHNWLNRGNEIGLPQNAWLTYTWDSPVTIDYTDVYYFSDGGGILIPESVSFEYLNEAGEWVPVENAQGLSCTEDEYNRIRLDVETTAIRMTLDPQDRISDPANGVGVIEWKVYGEYVEVEPETVNKDALNAAIEEAERKAEADYTAESWEAFARALEAAKGAAADETAAQEAVDDATALLNAAMAALVAATPEPPVADVNKDALNALIAEGETYTRSNYTEESWVVFDSALADAQAVAVNEAATQEEVDAAAAQLEAAMEALVANTPEPPVVEIDKDALNALIAEAETYEPSGYTEESWAVFELALEEARTAAEKETVTQEEVNAAAAQLEAAMEALVQITPGVDLEAIKGLIAEGDKLKKEDYKADGWDAFEQALEAAKTAANTEGVSQDEIDQAAETLENAMKNLVKTEDSKNTGTDDSKKPTSGGSSTGNTSTNKNNSVKTGDTAPIAMLCIVLIIALAGIVVILQKKRARR